MANEAALTCENCGNKYDKAFKIEYQGESHIFDSFECAINSMAPRCQHCDTRIIGHGIEEGNRIFCCAACLRQETAASDPF